MSKPRVGILFGGRSTEHEVSVASATAISNALDRKRYAPVLIGVAHDGVWHVAEADSGHTPGSVIGAADTRQSFAGLRAGLELLRREDARPALAEKLDVVFPIIHGRGGEDGSLQGMLELAEIPYVGCGVLATALCMDKALAKALLRDAGIPVIPYREISRHEALLSTSEFENELEGAFPYPLFVKPTNTGSSIGVQKVRTRSHLHHAIKEAARYDHDVLVEPGVDAREIECAVLGGHAPQASQLGEVRYAAEFYDYEAKYASESTQILIPADVTPVQTEEMRRLALAAFRALKCWGMARVDFFLEKRTGKVFLNELNTLPGFTDSSMYPKLWEATGIALPELCERLIELAFERRRETASLEIKYSK
ncbi:MAG TPA: D-alanine--D-alanine ligase family protein [Myxococcota bacterium]|nr:D-alanine--D-alanine ligase family protein [Myxococcota bacterium]